MRIEDTYDVLYTHTEGEPLCIVHSGIPYPAGTSLLEKKEFLEKNFDWLRLALMREPRGHKDMVGVFITPPSSPEFDAGLIYMDATQYQYMCGHGTIAVGMMMVARGMVKRAEGDITPIRFETLAGTVTAEVATDGDKVLWTKFENVPSYVAARDIDIDVPDLGQLKADVVWGGNYFGVVDLRNTKLRIRPENGKELSYYGLLIRDILREKIKPQHPSESHIRDIGFITFWHDPDIEGAYYKNVHVFGDGQLDRAPGGTAMSGMMALFEARGELAFNQPILAEGLLGTGTYEGELLGEVDLNGVRALRPSVKGKAGLLGGARWTFNRADPVDGGFVVR